MRSLTLGRSRTLLLPAAALLIALVAGSIAPTRTWAGLIGCDTDPVVALSNGASVTMWTSIATDPSNVTQVSYVLHVPKHVDVTSVQYDQFGYLENVQVVNDQRPHHYTVEASVSTAVDPVPVTTWATVSASHPDPNRTDSASGSSGDDLVISFDGP